MTVENIVNDLSKSVEMQSGEKGAYFANLTQISTFLQLNIKDTRKLLKGLDKIGQRYYIADVAERILMNRTVA